MGMIELTLNSKLTDDQRESLQFAFQASHNQLDLINDILNFSKIETGSVEIKIVKRTVGLLHGTIPVKSKLGSGTQFSIELPLKLNPNVSASQKIESSQKSIPSLVRTLPLSTCS
ncbi:MAG: signal transduction histidine kinase [Candidatus Pelagisphaera sp.]|jgi:signal transduction histidine kinase